MNSQPVPAVRLHAWRVPFDVQREALARGLIPYVPADRQPGAAAGG
ncbi:MAG TPA: hypothetical protein VF316_22285 [Polyangiaceae bacterium]